MFFRLLLVMLMLAGPLPARACTCAAGTDRGIAENLSATIVENVDGETCDCHHRAESPQVVEASTVAFADSSSHSDRHDRDCPAIKAPALVVGVQSGTVNVVLQCFDYVLPSYLKQADEPAKPFFLSGGEPTSRSVPRYISFLTLRI